jgi:hypothetical protein
MSELGDEPRETAPPPAPGGASYSLDDKKVDTDSQPNGDAEQYFTDKSTLTSEGILNQFRELREATSPGDAVLVTEVQELKELVQRLNITLAIILPIAIVSAGCLALIMLDVNKAVKQ